MDNIFNKGLYLSFKAYNMLDNDIIYPTFTNNVWADKGTLGHGRMLMLTAGWNFSL